ncbi:MAG: site-2 protease family protein [Thermodesulfobacteriota bacterium]
MDERRFEVPRTFPAYPPYPAYGAPTAQAVPERRIGSSTTVHVLLFVLTFLTTTMAGALHEGIDPVTDPWGLVEGLPFSTTLMLILLCHELGHYSFAAFHRVPATLPYFIPGPPFLVGTFGAFIRMQGMPRTRRALFDVGAAGPWAGFVVAVPAVVLGLGWSEVRPLETDFVGGLSLGNSLLFSTLSRWVLGVHPDDATILLHPVALAGWFGIFVTFLNLLPVGQLDGGHVVYALFGRGHRMIARLFFVVVLGMGFLGWQGWFVWALLLGFVLRVDHPDTADRDTPLDPFRKLAAWATIGVFVATFMPVPLSVLDPVPVREPVPFRREAPRPPYFDDRDRHPLERDGSLMDIRAGEAPSRASALVRPT